MFRDKSHLMKRLKMALGVYSIALPVSDNELFEDVIVDTTIPVFSTYIPYEYSLIVDLNELRIVDRYAADDSSLISNMYEIPDLFTRQRCIGINNIRPYIEYNGMMMTSSYETIDSYQVLATGQTLADLSSTMVPPQTWKFIPPNKFQIFNQVLYNNKVHLDLIYTHSPELFTIPETARESFFKLALLDTKMYLYNALKYYAQIQTAYANMDLKIEQWENAETERQDLLNQWDENYHLDSVPAVFFI